MLSILIVVVFAVLLHENEAPPPAQSKAEVARPAEGESPQPPTPAPPPARPEAIASEEVAPRPAPAAVVANRSPAPPPAPKPIPIPIVVAPATPMVVEPAAKRPEGATAKARVVADRREQPARPKAVDRPTVAPRRPRSAFAEVGPGESLVDVATRVYGSPDAVKALWRANRDRIVRPEDPVSAGTWLRTP